MKKPFINDVLEYLEELYNSDPDSLVSSRSLSTHFNRRCGPLVSELHRKRGLLVMVSTDKEGRNKIVNYRIDASKGFEPVRPFDSVAYMAKVKQIERERNEAAIRLHNVLFGNGWVSV